MYAHYMEPGAIIQPSQMLGYRKARLQTGTPDCADLTGTKAMLMCGGAVAEYSRAGPFCRIRGQNPIPPPLLDDADEARRVGGIAFEQQAFGETGAALAGDAFFLNDGSQWGQLQ